jgi:hypothetical protein
MIPNQFYGFQAPLILSFSPRGEGTRLQAAADSLSPWGEGWGEGVFCHHQDEAIARIGYDRN